VVGGAVIGKTRELHEQLVWWANCLGLTGSAFDSFLTRRGLRTLHVRLRQHGTTPSTAEGLEQQPQVRKVYYPGLPAHPGQRTGQPPAAGFRRHHHL